MVITRDPREVSLHIDESTYTEIQAASGGEMVLSDIEELLDCLRSSLPSASLAMVGKVLDGSIKVRARTDGWWRADWDRHTLGILLGENDVKRQIVAKIGDGGWERLKGSGVYVRNVGAHHKFEGVSMDEAMASARVVFDFLPRWWR